MANAAVRRGGDVADEVEDRTAADGDNVGMPIDAAGDDVAAADARPGLRGVLCLLHRLRQSRPGPQA